MKVKIRQVSKVVGGFVAYGSALNEKGEVTATDVTLAEPVRDGSVAKLEPGEVYKVEFKLVPTAPAAN